MDYFSNGEYDWLGSLESLNSEHHGEFGSSAQGHSAFDEYAHVTQVEPSTIVDSHHSIIESKDFSNECAEEGKNEAGLSGTFCREEEKKGNSIESLVIPTHNGHSAMPLYEGNFDQCLTLASYFKEFQLPLIPVNLENTTGGSSNGNEESEEVKKPSASRASSLSPDNLDDDDETKKNCRVQRKRNREKQRRLDTNSQFSTLAAIVREIETADFIEETKILIDEASKVRLDTEIKSHISASEGKNPEQKLKNETSPDSIFPGIAIDNTVSAAGGCNSSNRVELIARTTMILTQLRSIRKRKNEQLLDLRRQNCEMAKDIEDLRRMVAHYKTLNMGERKLQDKVMMMVPMMVPQEAVSSISAGFPAAHPCGGFSAPWRPAPSVIHAMSSTSSNHQLPGQMMTAAPPLQHSVNPNGANMSFQHDPMQFLQSSAFASIPYQMMLSRTFSGHGPLLAEIANTAGHPSTTMTQNQGDVQQLDQGSSPSLPPPPTSTHNCIQHQSLFPSQHAPMTISPYMSAGLTAPITLFGFHPNMQSTSNSLTLQQSNLTNTQQSEANDHPSISQEGGGNLAHCA